MKRCRSLARLPQEKVEVLVVEGNILVSLCRWDEAVEDCERALALAPASGKEALTQRIVLHRSRLFFTLGHYRLARQWAEKAVGRGTGGRTPTQAMALNAVATVAALTGDYQTAGRLRRRMSRSRPLAGLRLPGDTGAAQPGGASLRASGTTTKRSGSSGKHSPWPRRPATARAAFAPRTCSETSPGATAMPSVRWSITGRRSRSSTRTAWRRPSGCAP